MVSAIRDSNTLAYLHSANYRVRFIPRRSFATVQALCVDALSRGDTDTAQCIAVKVFGKRFSWAR